jgi:hypothetical protein
MQRREFLGVLSGAGAAWPLAVWGQQASLPPLIGVLSSGSAQLREDQSDGLRRGLKEAGFAEGENLTILYRGADDHYDRLPALGCGLINSGPETCRCESDRGEEVACELIEAGCNAPEMLELAEEPLD